MKKTELIQYQYHTKTGSFYDDIDLSNNDKYYVGLQDISKFIFSLEIFTILDVGRGTGRGVKYFLDAHLHLRVHGIKPVEALIQQAISKHGVSADLITIGTGESLPFEDNSFDAVCQFRVLHHVKNLNLVLSEMMRVTRRVVFLSDCNRFDQKTMFLKVVKIFIYQFNLWNLINFIKRNCKNHKVYKNDGLAYFYSVFNSYDILAKWADRIIVIATTKHTSKSWFYP